MEVGSFRWGILSILHSHRIGGPFTAYSGEADLTAVAASLAFNCSTLSQGVSQQEAD